VEQVREACLAGRDISQLLSNEIAEVKASQQTISGIQRIADVPIYFADPLARRSPPLQKTRDAQAPRAWMNAKLLARLNLVAGDRIKITQDKGEAVLAAALDDKLPDDCVRVAAAHASTASLGAPFGTLTLEKISSRQAA
jgi:NADH-quinone oxidoreductase subunit G